jgi:hydrogenase maturation protease
MTGRTLIACLGNIFLGDDGFGVEVAKHLAGQELPAGVRVTDYGIRGMHLAYDLAEGFDTTILVDCVQRGDEPGTVYVIEPEPAPHPATPVSEGGGTGEDAALAAMSLFNAHGMQPDVVLEMAGTLGAEAGRVLVVGCEPASLEEGIGLSQPVAAAVEEAARAVIRLVTAGGPRPDEEVNAAEPQPAAGAAEPHQPAMRRGRSQKARQGDKGSPPRSTKG